MCNSIAYIHLYGEYVQLDWAYIGVSKHTKKIKNKIRNKNEKSSLDIL